VCERERELLLLNFTSNSWPECYVQIKVKELRVIRVFEFFCNKVSYKDAIEKVI
jgi:hypothetical protein